MTFHFNDFEAPPGLDEAAAEEKNELAGCEIHQVIDACCDEPGCPNNPLTARTLLSLAAPDPRGLVYRTRPKTRCVL